MGVCCVDGCEPDDKEDVTYFPFPIKPALRRKWREAIKPATKLHIDSKVCSRHFPETDYERVRGKLRLKGRRVPTIFHRTQKNQQKSYSPETNGTSVPSPHTPSTTPPPVPSPKAPSPQVLSPQAPSPQTQSPKAQSPQSPSPQDLPKTPPITSPSRVPDEYRVPEFGLTDLVSGDDSAENCTVECVPEAILHEDSDTNSETELHKEDIEDIIANYHIKQNKQLAERLKPCDAEKPESQAEKLKESQAEKHKESQAENHKENQAEKHKESQKEKQKSGKNAKEKRDAEKVADSKTINVDDDDSLIEIEVEPLRSEEPVFIEISVDDVNSGSSSPRDDCMMVLENVECDVDPAALLVAGEADDPNRKEDPISLLTSSDDDDVIIQEPHIDTVEVSDETDEDDVPLVKLVSPKTEAAKNLTKLLWGNLYEYYCFQCHFKTTKKGEFKRHKQQHSTVIQMCEVCNFTSPSKTQFERHKKKHKDEKRFKCHLCEYKAKHNMSLMYHLKSHEGVTIEAIRLKEKLAKKMKFAYKCSKCIFQTNVKGEMLSHVKACSSNKMYACNECAYKTKRKSDLRRHRLRKHMTLHDGDDDEEYVP